MAGESSLDLGVALGQDPAALGDTGDTDLELLAAAEDLLAALLELPPGVQGLGQVRERPDELGLLGGDLGEALLCVEDGGAGVIELGGQSGLLLGRALDLGALGLERGTVAVGRTLGRGAGVACPRRRDAGLGQRGLGELGRGGSGFGPALRLFDRGLGDDTGGVAHAPARGGEAVALGRDHDEVVAGEREVDGLLPAVDAYGAADKRVEHGLGDCTALAGADVRAYGLGAGAGREPRRGGVRPAAPRSAGAPARHP